MWFGKADKFENSLRGLSLQFVKSKQIQRSSKNNFIHQVIKFVQKLRLLDNSDVRVCTWFSASESNNSRVLPLSFFANNLYGEHKIKRSEQSWLISSSIVDARNIMILRGDFSTNKSNDQRKTNNLYDELGIYEIRTALCSIKNVQISDAMI